MFSAGPTARKNPQGKSIRIKPAWEGIGKAVNLQLNSARIFNRTRSFRLIGRPFDMLPVSLMLRRAGLSTSLMANNGLVEIGGSGVYN